jgi:hypothetical protein
VEENESELRFALDNVQRFIPIPTEEANALLTFDLPLTLGGAPDVYACTCAHTRTVIAGTTGLLDVCDK